MSALPSILLQKSPRRSCRIKIRNNRIGANGFLNQRCALTPDLESILRTQTGKILLQQNLQNAFALPANDRWVTYVGWIPAWAPLHRSNLGAVCGEWAARQGTQRSSPRLSHRHGRA